MIERHGEDLNPIEEARACAALVEELGLTREQVGRRVGRSRVAVSNLLRLLDLADETIELIERGELTEGHGRALLLAEDHTARRRLARDAAREGWSVRTVEARARDANQKRGLGRRCKQGWRAQPTSESLIQTNRRPRPRSPTTPSKRRLGAEVKVRPRRRVAYRAELSFAGPEEALELVEAAGEAADAGSKS